MVKVNQKIVFKVDVRHEGCSFGEELNKICHRVS